MPEAAEDREKYILRNRRCDRKECVAKKVIT
jgi:hypothetical protein